MTNPEINQTSIRRSTWKSSYAWQCTLALILLPVGVNFVLRRITSTSIFTGLVQTHPYGFHNVLTISYACAWVLFAYWFSRSGSLREFAEKVGLFRSPGLQGWIVGCVMIGIGIAGRYGAEKGWTSPDPVQQGLFSTGGQALVVYLVLAVSVVPFFEEVVLRGFLYHAFRGSHGQFLTSLFVIVIQAWFHWARLIHSLWTPTCMISGWALLCILREKTGKVWDCVVCHAVYNAAVLLSWPASVAAMVLFLPVCSFSTIFGGREKRSVQE